MDTAAYRKHDLLNKNLVPDMRYFPMLFIKEAPEFPKTTQAIPDVLGCLLQLNSKALMKAQYTLVAGHRKAKLELAAKVQLARFPTA